MITHKIIVFRKEDFVLQGWHCGSNNCRCHSLRKHNQGLQAAELKPMGKDIDNQ